MLIDNYGRKIEYLRISVTDRCNFRCIYCQSRDPIDFIPREELLTYEEIEEVVKTGVELGVRRVRLTGGEPLGRTGIESLVEKLARIEGLQDLSLTTNGYLLLEKAETLKKAGLQRLNVSLDTLKPEKFKKITGGFSFDKIWRGILKAHEVGFNPLKINVVVIKGLNEEEILDLARLTQEYPWEIRFIEFMPLGGSALWDEENVLSIGEIKKALEAIAPLEPVSSLGGGPARVFKWKDAPGKLGFISPLSEHFCGKCNRFRITADGRLRTCLFLDEEINLKDYLRGSRGPLKEAFFLALKIKPEKRILKPTQRPMRAIGG